MPMSPRLLRPRQNVHPEAANWANRVLANGGTVSGSTLAAVGRFCRAIDAAGIRSKFYRLNLFCGTGLSACLVPLYRNISPSSSPLGNATDTNAGGLFVSGDYSESSGLNRPTGNRYLDTGLSPDNLPLSVVEAMHLSVSHGPVQSGNLDPRLLGTRSSASHDHHLILTVRSSPNTGSFTALLGIATSVVTGSLGSGAQPSASWIASRTSSTSLAVYQNGVLSATNTASTTGMVSHANPIYVFKLNNNGSAFGDNANITKRHYSIGAGLTAGEAGSYEAALAAFRTALGRTA